jgi:hypothetical protein
MKAKHSASSSDEIAVFQAYTDLINSERETLWARHNALLLANSLIIGALAIRPAAHLLEICVFAASRLQC